MDGLHAQGIRNIAIAVAVVAALVLALALAMLLRLELRSRHKRREYEQEQRQYEEALQRESEQRNEFLASRERQRRFAEEQRRLMTPSLRYDVLRRDGFRCQICGASAKDGVRLEVDHIYPVSRGGRTEMSNLRTLCERCNRGKGAKLDDQRQEIWQGRDTYDDY